MFFVLMHINAGFKGESTPVCDMHIVRKRIDVLIRFHVQVCMFVFNVPPTAKVIW